MTGTPGMFLEHIPLVVRPGHLALPIVTQNSQSTTTHYFMVMVVIGGRGRRVKLLDRTCYLI
ncbi:hypothetical protein D3C73_1302270 [compost metagenome]